MSKKATLDDFGDKPEKVVFPVEHMEEFAQKLKDKFGDSGRRGLNKFYQKAGIATVAWGMKFEGAIEKIPFGKIVTIIHYPNMKGQKIWKDYILRTEFPFEFWEDLFYQTHRHFAKETFIEQKKIEGLEELASSIGTEIHE